MMATLCFYLYFVDLQKGKKPILTIIDTMSCQPLGLRLATKCGWQSNSMTTIPRRQCLLPALLVNNGGYHWPALVW